MADESLGAERGAAIAIDATIVRALLVPALMKVMGDRNWWLPVRVARIARVRAPGRLAAESDSWLRSGKRGRRKPALSVSPAAVSSWRPSALGG